MRIKMFERFKYKITGRAVPVVKCEDLDEIGRVRTLHLLGRCGKRANSIISPWDTTGWEIDKDEGAIRLIDEKGLESQAFIVSESGKTISIYAEVPAFPNYEKIIGAASMLDDVADSMDLHKSMKHLLIGLVMGCGIGAVFLGPLLQAMLA